MRGERSKSISDLYVTVVFANRQICNFVMDTPPFEDGISVWYVRLPVRRRYALV